MAEGGGSRDERRGSSASEVGTDDGTATKNKTKKQKQNSIILDCRKMVSRNGRMLFQWNGW